MSAATLDVAFDAVDYLATKGIHGKPTTGAEVIYPCLWCTKPKLYLNTGTGMYHCHVCQASGGSTLLQRHFGDDPHRPDATPLPRRAAVLEAAARAGERMLTQDDPAMLYLLGQGRWLPAEVVVARRLGYVGTRTLSGGLPIGEFAQADIDSAGITWRAGPQAGTDFFRNVILIPYIEDGKIVQLRGKSRIDGRYYTAQGETARLYNADALKGADEVVIVEGEFDAMILADLLASSPEPKVRQIAVVGLPGVGSVPSDFDELLAGAKRIHLGTDPDEAGRRGANKLADRLGARARVPDWPAELLTQAQGDGYALKDIDWTLWIGRYGATWADVLVMLRQSSRLSSMAVAGSRFRNRPAASGLKLGYAELDAWIHPGMQAGQLMIPLAKTGVGKTLFLCNVVYNLRGRRVLFVSLEMMQEELYEQLARIYRFYKPYANDAEVEFSMADLRICDENRLNEADFAALIAEYTESVGAPPELVMVDYLGYYARGMKGSSSYEKTSNAVMMLKAEAKKHRVAVIAPHQVNRMGKSGKPLEADDARDSGVVEETADFLLGLYKPDDALDINTASMPSGRLRLELLKSRRGNKGKATTLQMGLLSLVIIDAVNPLAKQAEQENWANFSGMTYPQYLAQRTAPVQLSLRKDLA